MSVPDQQKDHPILRNWLAGTTCHKRHIMRSVLFENVTHIVLKHASHGDYCGRFSGVQTCQSYAALYLKSLLQEPPGTYNQSLRTGFGYLERWEGRISMARVLADCAAMGVHFPAA